MTKQTKESSESINKKFDQAFFTKAISELLMQNIKNAPEFFDCLETDRYNNEIIDAIRSDPDKSATISGLIIYLASMGKEDIYGIDENGINERRIQNIVNQIHYVSNYCAKIFSLLSIEEIEEIRIPSLSNPDPTELTLIDAVNFITQQSSISRKSLMVISGKYRDKLMEKSQKNPPEFDYDFRRYFRKYLEIEKTLTQKAFDLFDLETLMRSQNFVDEDFANTYFDYERSNFQARKFFEPLLTLKLYNRIPLGSSPETTINLANPDNFISQQLQFSVTAEMDEKKISINTEILKFYEKLRNKLLDPSLEDKRAKCIELLDKTVENYLFLKQLSEDKELNKELDNEKDFDKFFEYYKTNLNHKYQAALVENALRKLFPPTRLPPPSAQQAPAPAPPTKKETSIEDDIKKIFNIALSSQELSVKTKFINSGYAKFQKYNRSTENYLSFLESALDDTKTEGQKSKLDKVSENLMPQILNSIPKEAIENYFTTTDPQKPLSEFGLAILRESLKLGYLEINTEILNKALNSESAVMFLDMALEPRNLDLLINGSQVSRASQTVGYDETKSFLTDRLALLSDKNKEKLLKTLLSDDEKYENIKTNKELILSSLGLDFIQGFYEQSTPAPQENPARSRRSINSSTNREHNKLSDKEKQDLLKLLLLNPDFEESQFKVFLNKLTKENPAIIIEFFKPTSQFDIYQIKILKSLDPKTLAEKFILEDSIINEESKTSFLKSYLELGNLDNNKILIDLISRSPKSSILEPLFKDDNRDLIFNSCKVSTFYHKFIEAQDRELDEETQSERVSMYLSSNKNDEQKVELLNLLAQKKPELFFKKLLEDDDNRDLIFNSYKGSTFYHKFIEAQDRELDEETQSERVSMYLSSNKNDEQKVELLNLLAKEKPELFFKKLLDEPYPFFQTIIPF
jgi:hypothetical protein